MPSTSTRSSASSCRAVSSVSRPSTTRRDGRAAQGRIRRQLSATWDYAVVLTIDWYRPKQQQHWSVVAGECHWQHLCDLFVEGDGLLDIGGSGVLDGTGVGAPKTAETEFRNCLILGKNVKALHTMRRIMEYLAYNQSVEEGDDTEEEQISEHAFCYAASRASPCARVPVPSTWYQSTADAECCWQMLSLDYHS